MALENYAFRPETLTARGELEGVLVYADHPIIARKAFRAAVEQYPKTRTRLRNRALVMESTCRALAREAGFFNLGFLIELRALEFLVSLMNCPQIGIGPTVCAGSSRNIVILAVYPD